MDLSQPVYGRTLPGLDTGPKVVIGCTFREPDRARGHVGEAFTVSPEPEGLPGWAIAAIAAFVFGLVCGLVSILSHGGVQ